MPVKMKDEEHQGKLFGFLGIKKPVQPPIVDLKNDPEFQKGYLLPSYYDPAPRADDLIDARDMVREALDVVDPERLRFRQGAVVGYVFWVLVCPQCNSPVEAVPPAPMQEPEGVLVYRGKWKPHPTFAYCDKCDTNFFIVELVKDRSFRRKFPTDMITCTIDFLKGKA